MYAGPLIKIQLVNIFYDVSKVDELPTMPTINLTLAIMDMIASLSIRYSAKHICLKARQEKLNLFNLLFQWVFKLCPRSYDRVRTRMPSTSRGFFATIFEMIGSTNTFFRLSGVALVSQMSILLRLI